MVSGIEQLIDLHRADSAAKVTRVLAALDAMICSGDPPHCEQIEQTLFETQEDLARRCDELEAARQINRELMARLNRERK